MISNISNNLSSGGMPEMRNSRQQSITQEQRQLIEETLAQYDPENLTQDQAASIVDTFKEAGIEPSYVMAEAMTTLGFDARAIGDLAGVGDPQQVDSQKPPPPPPNQDMPTTLNISDSALQELKDLLEEYYNNDLSEDERETKLGAIKEVFQGTILEGSLVNVYA